MIVAALSAALILLLLRCLMAATGVESRTVAWAIVDTPTGLLIDPLERIDFFARTPVAELTVATILVSLVTSIGALVVLGTLANRRD